MVRFRVSDYNLWGDPNISMIVIARLDDQMDRQTEDINTFRLFWKVLKIGM